MKISMGFALLGFLAVQLISPAEFKTIHQPVEQTNLLSVCGPVSGIMIGAGSWYLIDVLDLKKKISNNVMYGSYKLSSQCGVPKDTFSKIYTSDCAKAGRYGLRSIIIPAASWATIIATGYYTYRGVHTWVNRNRATQCLIQTLHEQFKLLAAATTLLEDMQQFNHFDHALTKQYQEKLFQEWIHNTKDSIAQTIALLYADKKIVLTDKQKQLINDIEYDMHALNAGTRLNKLPVIDVLSSYNLAGKATQIYQSIELKIGDTSIVSWKPLYQGGVAARDIMQEISRVLKNQLNEQEMILKLCNRTWQLCSYLKKTPFIGSQI